MRDFPASAAGRLIAYLRGDRSASQVDLALAAHELLGWGLAFWQGQAEAGAAPVGAAVAPRHEGPTQEDAELANALEGLAQAQEARQAVRTTAPPQGEAQAQAGRLPDWLLPLVSDVLRRILERRQGG